MLSSTGVDLLQSAATKKFGLAFERVRTWKMIYVWRSIVLISPPRSRVVVGFVQQVIVSTVSEDGIQVDIFSLQDCDCLYLACQSRFSL